VPAFWFSGSGVPEFRGSGSRRSFFTRRTPPASHSFETPRTIHPISSEFPRLNGHAVCSSHSRPDDAIVVVPRGENMTEDRLTRIEETLQVLVVGQAGLLAGQNELREGQDELRAGQDELRTGQAELRTGQARLEARLDKVEVGQEEMRDQIAQIAEGHGALHAAIERGFEMLRAEIHERIEPLERALRRRD